MVKVSPSSIANSVHHSSGNSVVQDFKQIGSDVVKLVKDVGSSVKSNVDNHKKAYLAGGAAALLLAGIGTGMVLSKPKKQDEIA